MILNILKKGVEDHKQSNFSRKNIFVVLALKSISR